MGSVSNNISDKTPNIPARCKACGLTQKECHLAMKAIHDPEDPTNVVFVDQNT